MIWFDLDNSPHVPLFIPVFAELEKRNIPFDITARDFAQTLELLNMQKIRHTAIGHHGGKNKVKKIINLLKRSGELKKYIRNKFPGIKLPKLSVSHGSRTQLVASKRLGIRSLLMMDYEYTETRIFNRCADEILVPVMIPDERLLKNGIQLSKVTRYNGFKEELYLASFKPDLIFRKSLGIDEGEILAVIRPPGMLGNYHDSRSEELLIYAINHLSVKKNCIVLISNRSQKDRDLINFHLKDKQNIRFLEKAVDGLQLVNAADLVLSGGGTMNRESALLGTKTYSIFTGRRPYLDELLEKEGRLKFISSKEEIDEINAEKISLKDPYPFNKNITAEITDIIANRANIRNG
jgi:uncharacterized protein